MSFVGFRLIFTFLVRCACSYHRRNRGKSAIFVLSALQTQAGVNLSRKSRPPRGARKRAGAKLHLLRRPALHLARLLSCPMRGGPNRRVQYVSASCPRGRQLSDDHQLSGTLSMALSQTIHYQRRWAGQANADAARPANAASTSLGSSA